MPAHRYAGQLCVRLPEHEELPNDQRIIVTVAASDLGGVLMTPYSYGFYTEMRAFGASRKASDVPDATVKEAPATVTDSAGTIWMVYETGDEGEKDIYISSMAANKKHFSKGVSLTSAAGDQSDPTIAVDADDTLYVAWTGQSAG